MTAEGQYKVKDLTAVFLHHPMLEKLCFSVCQQKKSQEKKSPVHSQKHTTR